MVEKVYTKILSPFYRLTNSIDAIEADDFNLDSHSPFRDGVSNQVFERLSKLRIELSLKKRRFNERNLLIYQLIEQLDSPVLILDQYQRLIHANLAFSDWHGKEWYLSRLLKAEQLGIERNSKDQWQLGKNNTPAYAQYQIKESRFLAEKGEHQLLIMTDIAVEIKAAQMQSWQQLIRVLGHEIHNSLTSIKSLSQTLLMDAVVEQQPLLNVIVERSDELSHFVKDYSDIYKPCPVNPEIIVLQELFSQLRLLFPDANIVTKFGAKALKADAILIKQVLINLLKNADEANLVFAQNTSEAMASQTPATIEIESYIGSGSIFITIKDQGLGIQNLDNLFVPFYTTKAKGQGIGLCFCRHIIELHGGRLTLNNRSQHQGAEASIQLPIINREYG